MSLEFDSEGVFIIEKRFLSLVQIQNRKHHVEQRIIRIRDEIAELRLKIGQVSDR